MRANVTTPTATPVVIICSYHKPPGRKIALRKCFHISFPMHPALENTFSPTPSRFAHLQTIEPLTTASGIIPGQALFDTPPTDNSPPLLERYHRTRKPTTRKIEASQSQPSTSKSKGKQPVKNATTASKPSSKSLRNAGNLSTSDSNADAGTQAAGTGEDIDQEDNHSNNNNNNGNGEDDEDDTYISQAIIEKLEGIVGHSVSHLSNRQLKTLLDAAWATQEITLESQAEQSPTIAKSHAGVGLAGGGHNGSPVHQDMHSLSQRLNTSGGDLLTSRKRPLDAIDIAANSKRVRISTGKDDSATEDESDSDLDPPRRRRRCRTNASDSDSDSDSDSEAEPPIAALPQPQRLPTGSQGGASLKPTHPKPIPTARPAASSSLPPSLVSAHPTTLTTSSNSPTALGNPLNATTYLVRYPPPTDLNDVDALAVWAIQRAQVLGYSPSNPKAIASHRSQLSGAERPGSQDASSRPSQSTSINLASAHEVTPSNDSTSATGASATLGHQKAKHKPKSKLGNFLGPSGEVASAAIPYFLATVFADGAYENLEVFRDWALDAYRETWKLEYPEFEYEVPPKGLLVIVSIHPLAVLD
ncbi:hypothetical protein BDV93DRAFT_37452 [Ceratobasidium sp. AG-I]|nr:hypothetical protein BDV93DRAFT_37452 [Ceratobasidium sp. AG-I]